MQLCYDEGFVEAAVLLCLTGRRPGISSLQIARFHHERERLYRILDAEERNAGFFRLHLEWFREWGMELPLRDTLREFPLLREKLEVLAVRQATGRSEEGAELYVNEAGRRTGLVALRVGRLSDEKGLKTYLRHEFSHLHDMLDPAFGYSPELKLAVHNAAQKRLACERYRLLWDITIDGRLAAAGHQPACAREEHAAAFARGFAFWPDERCAATFEALWRNSAPRHADLLALIADPRGLSQESCPAPGACCPLCDFPTFQWADARALPPEVLRRIEAEFAGWRRDQGLCHRCLEAYQALSQSSLAPSA